MKTNSCGSSTVIACGTFSCFDVTWIFWTLNAWSACGAFLSFASVTMMSWNELMTKNAFCGDKEKSMEAMKIPQITLKQKSFE